MARLCTLLFATLLSGSALALSDTLTIPVGQQTAAPFDAPARGDTAARVEARLGAPLQQTPAVGKPPISRWEYPDFTVYFESGAVLHTVAKQRASVTSSRPSEGGAKPAEPLP